ncbi:transcriptional regulator [Marinomonas sp. MED121]|uniref:TetR family transcriptional regulator C-terminal domain-containing protein n=1 Tax=Marinomonas sp. MED121 TaxID=314277 RepID=UPI00006904C7|nr:TetR family transcriptional regulator C-terminal domain-containing protein [Marinomonas sp. MED121]EAQ64773.1 transcriptional regulator [Marinomonas sp. MED121]
MSTKRREGNNRRQELIEATLNCIENEGIQGATVRKVADYAGVTNGLIRFYFSGKDELIRAAYAALLEQIYVSARANIEDAQLPVKERLRRFIQATLSFPIVSPRTVLLWANFLPLTYIDDEMAAIRNEGYVETTNILQPLVIASLAQENRNISEEESQRFAIKLNAVIDGLWLEGSMAGYKFQNGELAEMGVETASSILAINLAN